MIEDQLIQNYSRNEKHKVKQKVIYYVAGHDHYPNCLNY